MENLTQYQCETLTKQRAAAAARAAEAFDRAKATAAEHASKRPTADQLVSYVRLKFPHDLSVQIAFIAVQMHVDPLNVIPCRQAIDVLVETGDAKQTLQDLFR